jgi:hypothetical protein
MNDHPKKRLTRLRTTGLPRPTRLRGSRTRDPACRGMVPVAASRKRGELVIVAHFTHPIGLLSMEQCSAIFEGRVFDFRRIGGSPARCACRRRTDRRTLAKTHRVSGTIGPAGRGRTLASDRSLLGLCDARALRPHFKVIAVDGVFPWGRRDDGYTIDRDAPYPLLLPGAAPWKSEKSCTVVQTGVTAMTRAFIAGVDRPASSVSGARPPRLPRRRTWPSPRSRCHFSNCGAYPLKDRMRFCSPPRFLRIMMHSGFDVIELPQSQHRFRKKTQRAHPPTAR